MKQEGPVFPPLSLARLPLGETGRTRRASEEHEPRCEMCGSAVITSHCKRICLKCGFLTGCSEGL